MMDLDQRGAMLILITALVSLTTAEDVTVSVVSGELRGERVDYDHGQYYYAFKGVPYAKPPVKDLRFQV